MATQSAAQLVYIGEFEVWVTRKRVKNLSLRVSPPDGRIEVNMPLRACQRDVEELVLGHADWIRKKQATMAASPMAQAGMASAQEARMWKKVVESFVPDLVAKWEPVLGVRVNKIAYRNMTSRWGSCQPATGRVCINTRLALYPPECLEYVVVHELCHLRVHGHGPAFWALVEQCLPDYKQSRAKLK